MATALIGGHTTATGTGDGTTAGILGMIAGTAGTVGMAIRIILRGVGMAIGLTLTGTIVPRSHIIMVAKADIAAMLAHQTTAIPAAVDIQLARL